MTELEKSLVAAQADLGNPPKTETARVPTKSGGSYSYTYAPLPDILDLVKPALFKHGLAIAQNVVGEAGYVGVMTELIHVSGERLIYGPVMLPATDPQQAGGVITYLRRYSLCAALGIAADEDTDAKPSPVRSDEPQASARAGDSTSPAGPGGAVTPSGVAGDYSSGPVAGGVRSSALDPGPDLSSAGAIGEGGPPAKSAAGSNDAAAAPGPGEDRPSPGSPKKYPVDPASCDHKFPSGRWLRWEDGRCPRCGTPKAAAMAA